MHQKKAMLIKVMMFTQMGVVEHGKYKNALYDVEYPSEYKKFQNKTSFYIPFLLLLLLTFIFTQHQFLKETY